MKVLVLIPSILFLLAGVLFSQEIPLSGHYAVSAALGKDQPVYHVQKAGDAYRATNTRQHLTAEFRDGGVKVAGEALRFDLELQAFGFGDVVEPVAAGATVARENRVEIRHGNLTEWYVNGPLGLQQGFTVTSGPGDAGVVTLVLALRGSLEAELEPDARGLVLKSARGEPVFWYTGLTAFDATGRDLKSWIEVDAGQIRIRTDAAGATYPVVIDPWITQASLKAGDGATNDQFGWAVAMDGDTVVVSAPRDDVGKNTDQGSVYVFVRNGKSWSQQAKLTAQNGAVDDHFGSSVAICGDLVVVGAPRKIINSKQYHGAAYIFQRIGNFWVQRAMLTPGDGMAGDSFGCAVGIHLDLVIIGARYCDIGSSVDQGAAYVFQGSGSTWIQQAKLMAGNGGADDSFGYAVDIQGDTAVISALWDDVGLYKDQGSAYVFKRIGSAWVQHAKLTASDSMPEDWLGASVALHDDTVVVGATGVDRGNSYNEGAAYLYEKPHSGWKNMTETAKFWASDAGFWDFFGRSVDLDHDTVVVGAMYDEVNSARRRGSARVFRKVNNRWQSGTESARLTACGGASEDFFGVSVALEGDTIVVGASGCDVSSNTDQGKAYVFFNDPHRIEYRTEYLAGGSSDVTTVGLAMCATFPLGRVSPAANSLGFNMDWNNKDIVLTVGTPPGPTTLPGPWSGIYRYSPATQALLTLVGPNTLVYNSPGKILLNQDGDYVFTNGAMTPSGLEYSLLKLSRHSSLITTILPPNALGRKTSFSGPISIDIDTGHYLVADRVDTSTPSPLKFPVLRVDDQGKVTTFCTGQSYAGGWRLPWSMPQDHRTGNLVGPYGFHIYEVKPGSINCTTLSTVSTPILEAVKFDLQTGPSQRWVASNGAGTSQYLCFIDQKSGVVTSIGAGQKNFSMDFAFYQGRHTQTIKMAPNKWQILLSAPDFPGKNYALVASISGVRPGIALPDGRNININLDQTLLLTLYNMMPALWNSGPGRLDANGEARGTLDLSYFGRLDLPLWITWLVLDPMAPGGIAYIPDTYVMRI